MQSTTEYPLKADASGKVHPLEVNGFPLDLPLGTTLGGVPIGTGGGVTDGDKGDITVSGGGTVWSVDSGAIDFSELAGKPTTIAGYGITDFNSLGDARWSLLGHTHTFASLTSKPTTAAGYGITNGATIDLWGAIAPGSKQDTITTGTTSQYFRGDLSLATFPTNVSSFTNDAGYLTGVTVNAPLSGAGTSASHLSMHVADTTHDGYLSSTDWNTFNNKQPAGSYGDFSSNTSTSVDGEVVLFSGTAGKTGKRATGSGLATLASGVLGTTPNNSSNWDTAYTDRLKWDGGSTGLIASTGRTSLGGTTIGQNLFTLTNPSAITFPRFNADNSVSALDAAAFRSAIGAGSSSFSGLFTDINFTGSNWTLAQFENKQIYDNAGTPKLAADFDARKFYAPDGSTIAFQLTDNANWDAYLGLICHDGLTVQSGGEFLINQWSWSPDYGTLLYYGNVVFDIEGTNVHLFAKDIHASGVFYGDGSGLTNIPYISVTGTPVIGTDVEAWSANLDAWSALATSAKQDHSTNLDGWSALATSAKANSGANTDITSLLLNQTGLVVKGGSANALTIKPNETLSAARILNLKVNDADRTVDLSGNLTLSHSITLDTDGTGTRTLNIGAGGTLGSAAFTASTAYDAAGAAAAVVSDTAYDATTWNGVTGIAPSKNAVRDWIETLGSAAYTASSAYATSAQGTKADNAGAVNGIVKSNGSASFSAVTDNSSNWDTAYTDRLKWDGGSTGLTAATGRTSLGLSSSDSPQFTGIELGNASDTTLSRASAGVLAVEGVNVLLNGGALGTPSSGTLTNATGLPVSGITASTSTALGVGSIELGHASDTTIARVSAGVVSIEGSNILVSGGALGTPSSGTLTNCTFPTLNQNTTGTANIAGGTVGAIPYQSAANTTTVLAATSTANKVLMSGASAAPTWSTPTFPNASATSGKVIKSDGTNWVASTETYATPGATGAVLQSDGTNWVRVLKTVAVSGTASSTTNNTAAETNLFTVTIPAGAISTNGNLRITSLWKMTGTNGTKTPVIRHNTTSGATSGGTVLWSISDAAGTLTHRVVVDVWNVNSASSQIFYPHSNANSLGTNSNAPETGAIDTSAVSYLNFNAFVANSGDTIGVVGYTVEIINP